MIQPLAVRPNSAMPAMLGEPRMWSFSNTTVSPSARKTPDSISFCRSRSVEVPRLDGTLSLRPTDTLKNDAVHGLFGTPLRYARCFA